jgi:hypothetical protein
MSLRTEEIDGEENMDEDELKELVIRLDESMKAIKEGQNEQKRVITDGFKIVNDRIDNWQCPSDKCREHDKLFIDIRGINEDNIDRIQAIEAELNIGPKANKDFPSMRAMILSLVKSDDERKTERRTLYKAFGICMTIWGIVAWLLIYLKP